MTNRFVPEKIKSFEKKNWVCIEGGQHHTVAQDDQGKTTTKYIVNLILFSILSIILNTCMC